MADCNLVHTWSELDQDAPMDKVLRRRIIGERVMISEVRLAKGFVVPTHQHDNEQMAMVISGKIRFDLGEEGSSDRRQVVLEGGSVMHLPANLPHAAEALEDTLIYDIFSPVSEGTGIDRA